MQVIGVFVFVSMLLSLGYLVNKEQHQEHEKIATWVVIGFFLVLGFLAAMGILKEGP